jgi:hypothetical protein
VKDKAKDVVWMPNYALAIGEDFCQTPGRRSPDRRYIARVLKEAQQTRPGPGIGSDLLRQSEPGRNSESESLAQMFH